MCGEQPYTSCFPKAILVPYSDREPMFHSNRSLPWYSSPLHNSQKLGKRHLHHFCSQICSIYTSSLSCLKLIFLQSGSLLYAKNSVQKRTSFCKECVSQNIVFHLYNETHSSNQKANFCFKMFEENNALKSFR